MCESLFRSVALRGKYLDVKVLELVYNCEFTHGTGRGSEVFSKAERGGKLTKVLKWNAERNREHSRNGFSA